MAEGKDLAFDFRPYVIGTGSADSESSKPTDSAPEQYTRSRGTSDKSTQTGQIELQEEGPEENGQMLEQSNLVR